jgi:hypothetical protein
MKKARPRQEKFFTLLLNFQPGLVMSYEFGAILANGEYPRCPTLNIPRLITWTRALRLKQSPIYGQNGA